MVIDSSALVAILTAEPEAREIARAIAADPRRLMSPVSALETAMVIEARNGPHGGRELDLLLHATRMEVVSMNADQWAIARECHRKYGKGRHPARLNLGDCCSYALARYSGEPLLFKGDDFPQTDIASVFY